MRNKILFTALAALALVLSACGAAATPTAAPVPTATSAPVATATSAPVATATGAPVATAVPPTATEMMFSTASGPAVVNVGNNSSLGSILTDANDMTLYIFTNDTPNTSKCYSACANAWPPLLTSGAPTGGTGTTASMLGTTMRSDGLTQVTYNGWPLYYFAGDKAAGDTNGEGKGGVWYVITPDGTQK